MAKIEIDHILCPMDFSAQSQQAYSYAVALARWYDARITALHVVAMRPAVEAIPSIYGAILPPAASDELKRALAGDLERCVRTADAAGLQVDVRVLEAPLVHQEVLAQARLLDSDLIVIIAWAPWTGSTGTRLGDGKSAAERVGAGAGDTVSLRARGIPGPFQAHPVSN